MKPSCINFIVCVICKIFRNEFRKYIFYVQCVYLCILIFACDVFKQFSKPFLRGTPQEIWSAVSSLRILTPLLSLYAPVLVIAGDFVDCDLLAFNTW